MRAAHPPSVSRIVPSTALRVLDPCSLGRPIHLLSAFTTPFAADLDDFLNRELNRRYGAAFERGTLTLERGGPADAMASRWRTHANGIGRIGVAIERRLLLAMMAYRYGGAPDAQAIEAAESARETATEERLADKLGLRLARLLAARIETGQEPVGGEAPPSDDFVRCAAARATAGTWTVRAEVREPSLGVDGMLWLTLDDAWMARLLRQLAPTRDKPAEPGPRSLPLAARLQLTLTGRLLQKELPLGELVDLRVGDVIPISLGATDVLVDGSRLFTAAVAEHKGKMCLSSFEPVE